MAAAGNVPLWRELDALGLLQAHGGWLLALSLTGMVAAVLFAILSLLAWRPLLKPAIVVLLRYGPAWLPTFRTLLPAGDPQALRWLLALAGCLGLSWLLGQGQRHLPHRPAA